MEEMSLAEFVKGVRSEQRLSMREFAEALTQSVKVEISHVSVNEWEKGRYEPGTDFLLEILVAYRDWRREFARGVLMIKLPEVFIDQAGELKNALFRS